jgi:hypothetical protein
MFIGHFLWIEIPQICETISFIRISCFPDEGNETEVQPQQNSQLMWKQGRQLLRQ